MESNWCLKATLCPSATHTHHYKKKKKKKKAPCSRHPAWGEEMDHNGRLQQPLSQLGMPRSWPWRRRNGRLDHHQSNCTNQPPRQATQQVEAQAPTVQQGWPLLPVKQAGTNDSVQAQDRPQPPQLSPIFQTPHWPYRAVPLRYWQSDNSPAPSTSHSERESGQTTLP